MLGFDSLREITATIKQNKLRTFLTGFAVAWGIFMLIVLLSAGNGFRNGVESQFASQAKNYIIINPGWTSKPYDGFSTGRRIRFDERDLAMLRREVPELEYLLAGMGTDVTITYGEEYVSASVEGATDQLRFITNITIKEDLGRFVNQIDMQQRRKVLILHPKHSKPCSGIKIP